jgi:hypothetical protein
MIPKLVEVLFVVGFELARLPKIIARKSANSQQLFFDLA